MAAAAAATSMSRCSTTPTFNKLTSHYHHLHTSCQRTPISRSSPRRLTILAATQGSAKSSSSKSEENIPSWAKPDSAEPPPWARDDDPKNLSEQTNQVPFYVYLLASAITAIAAIGSVFEYINQKPVFGLLDTDSIFYTPVLGFFALTGVPTSAFLWFKSVEAANKAAEEQDRKDGYR